MNKIINIFLLLILLESCSNNKGKKVLIKTTEITYKTKETLDSCSIDDLLSVLKQSKCVYGKHIGIEGKNSKEYEAFEKLNKQVSDSFLLDLTYCTNSAIKIYAYNALVERNIELSKIAQNHLKSDTTFICTQTNDMRFDCSIATYVTKFKIPK